MNGRKPMSHQFIREEMLMTQMKMTSVFRPISVIPIMMKIFDRAVHCQLTEYLMTHFMLAPEQSGFRKKSQYWHCSRISNWLFIQGTEWWSSDWRGVFRLSKSLRFGKSQYIVAKTDILRSTRGWTYMLHKLPPKSPAEIKCQRYWVNLGYNMFWGTTMVHPWATLVYYYGEWSSQRYF